MVVFFDLVEAVDVLNDFGFRPHLAGDRFAAVSAADHQQLLVADHGRDGLPDAVEDPGGIGEGAQRTNARVTCNSTGETISWRNHVDVDVNGENDTAEEPYNRANVNCAVN